MRVLKPQASSLRAALLLASAVTALPSAALLTQSIAFPVPSKSQAGPCGCSMDEVPRPTVREALLASRLESPLTDPACCSGAEIFVMPPQGRCKWRGPFGNKCQGVYDYYHQTRPRWKWKCPNGQVFISCGAWYDDGGCCSSAGTEPSCTGGSGLPVCQGTPPPS
jgi:hypothetical protein